MNSKIENQLNFKAATAFEYLTLAIQTFEAFLKEASSTPTPDYYKARNYLRDGEKFSEETFGEAKKLLGPLPQYAPADFEKWRMEYLSRHHILVQSEEFNSLKDELLKDEHLSRRMAPEDIERLLGRDFEGQKTGKRKLANIKIRIMLDRLQELLSQAQQLRKTAMDRLQTKG